MAPEEEKSKSSDAVTRALELELVQKRAGWQHKREKFRALRIASFVFLFLVIVGAILMFFLFFGRVNASRDRTIQATSTTEDGRR